MMRKSSHRKGSSHLISLFREVAVFYLVVDALGHFGMALLALNRGSGVYSPISILMSLLCLSSKLQSFFISSEDVLSGLI